MIPRINKADKYWKVLGYNYVILRSKRGRSETFIVHTFGDAIQRWWWALTNRI